MVDANDNHKNTRIAVWISQLHERSMTILFDSRQVILRLILVVVSVCRLAAYGDTPTLQGDPASGYDKLMIPIGMSTALSGPAAQLGQNVKAGVTAGFAEFNHSSESRRLGIRLRLISLDDGYEPSRTSPNMRRLIEDENVVAVIGNVGTPTAIAAIPIANSTRTLLFGAYTGAGALRKSPPDRYVINYRASYAEETASMVNALVKHAGIKPSEIAFFTQRDGYGDAGFNGGIVALKKLGLENEFQVAHGRYERNTVSVEKGLAEILLHPVPAKAVIMVGAYRPCAKFIELAKSSNFHPLFLNVSFVGSIPLGNALGSNGDGVVITQVVPHPEIDSPLARRHLSAIRRLANPVTPTFGSLEGYIASRILIKAISSIDGDVTRENVIDALEALGSFDLDSQLSLFLCSTEHQASHSIWPTVLKDGKVIPLEWSELRHFTSRDH